MFASVQLTPLEWLQTLRDEGARLRLSVPEAPRLDQRVTLRIQLSGTRVAATLAAAVRSVHRHEGQHSIEVAVESDSIPAVRMLSAAARDEGRRYVERPARYLTKLPVIVAWRGGNVYATTVSISRGGCSLKLSGAAPEKGTRLRLRVGAGPKAVELMGVVAWSRSAPNSTAGIRFIGAVPPPVAALVAEAERSGAPRA